MKIQVNSDKNVAVDALLTAVIEEEVSRTLATFARRLTRVEIHLSDVNSAKPGADDKRCLLEARPGGRRPLAVTNSAATVESAVRGALAKVRNALSRSFGKETSPRVRAKRAEAVPAPRRPGSRKSLARRTVRGRNEPVASTPVPEKRAAKKAGKKKAVAKKTTSTGKVWYARGPKKKLAHRARRKAWPKR